MCLSGCGRMWFTSHFVALLNNCDEAERENWFDTVILYLGTNSPVSQALKRKVSIKNQEAISSKHIQILN